MLGNQHSLAKQSVMYGEDEIWRPQLGRQVRRCKIHTDNLGAALDQPFRRVSSE